MKRGTIGLILCGIAVTAAIFEFSGFYETEQPLAAKEETVALKKETVSFKRTEEKPPLQFLAKNEISIIPKQKSFSEPKLPAVKIRHASFDKTDGTLHRGTIQQINQSTDEQNPFAMLKPTPTTANPFPTTTDPEDSPQPFPEITQPEESPVGNVPVISKKIISSKKTVKKQPVTHPLKAITQPIKPQTVKLQTAKPQITKLLNAPKLLNTVSATAKTAQITLQWTKLSDVIVGLKCQCGLIVKNNGSTAAQNVAVITGFPKSTQLINATPTPEKQTGQFLWKLGTFAPGEQKLIKIELIPTQRGQLAVSASVRFTGSAAGAFTVTEPILKIVLSGPRKVLIGESASQVIQVSNTGTGIATNVVVEAKIPAGLEHSRGERLVMNIGALNPGESRKVRLALAAISGGTQKIEVEAISNVTSKQQITTQVDVIVPSLQVTMQGPRLRYIGRKAQYTIRVANTGRGSTDNVRIRHRIPSGFKFINANQGGKYDVKTGFVNWFVGQLDAGKNAKVTVELAALTLGTQQHQVGAISEQGAKSKTTFNTKIDGTESLVLNIIDLNDPVEVGTPTAYEIRIRNTGTKAAAQVQLACHLPPGVTLLTAKGPTASAAKNGTIVFKPITSLLPGKTAVYRLQVRGITAGNHRFRARLLSETIKTPLTFEELTKFYKD